MKLYINKSPISLFWGSRFYTDVLYWDVSYVFIWHANSYYAIRKSSKNIDPVWFLLKLLLGVYNLFTNVPVILFALDWLSGLFLDFATEM